MLRDPHPDRSFLRVLRHLRYLAGGLQDEGVRPRGCRLDRAENPVVHLHESPELGELGDHQGEMVPVPQLPDPPDAFDSRSVAEGATERITGIGGVGDQPTLLEDPHHLAEGAGLRVLRMHVVVLGHGFTLNPPGKSGSRVMTPHPVHCPGPGILIRWEERSSVTGFVRSAPWPPGAR